MQIKELLEQAGPTRLGFELGRRLPPWAGLAVARWGAALVVWTKPDVYQAAYRNLQHVLGGETPESGVRAAVARLFQNAARGYYELFHNLGRQPLEAAHFQPPVQLLPESVANFEAARATGRGICIFGCHLANFDLSGLALAQYLDIPLQVLSLANPSPGFEYINQLRVRGRRDGQILTPITPEALREAVQRLRQGGVIITGVERPTGEGDETVTFFGAPARLPTGYIRLPLMTGALVMTMGTFYEAGQYHLAINPAWEPVRTGDRAQDVALNLRRVLDEIEALIRRYPDQWMIFVPVWPG